MRLRSALNAFAMAALIAPARLQAADPVQIDVVIPLTGASAFLGKNQLETLGIFEKVTNAAGGVRKACRPLQHSRRSEQPAGGAAARQRSVDPSSVVDHGLFDRGGMRRSESDHQQHRAVDLLLHAGCAAAEWEFRLREFGVDQKLHDASPTEVFRAIVAITTSRYLRRPTLVASNPNARCAPPSHCRRTRRSILWQLSILPRRM